MIEAWWRVLKHQWLYLNSLDCISTLRHLVTFYVQEHNMRLPHSALRGAIVCPNTIKEECPGRGILFEERRLRTASPGGPVSLMRKGGATVPS